VGNLDSDDLSGFSMFDLFRSEVENQRQLMTSALLALENSPTDDRILESLMRAAHSIKGAARIVNLDTAVKIAHRMEDAFEGIRANPELLVDRSVQGLLERTAVSEKYRGESTFRGWMTDLMLEGVDLLWNLASADESDLDEWIGQHQGELQRLHGDFDVFLDVLKTGGDLPKLGQSSGSASIDSGELADFSMLQLFRVEVENQKAVLTPRLLSLESDPTNGANLEELMRAAHSIKGAGRIVNLDTAVRVAHAMEDAFEAIREDPDSIKDHSLEGVAERESLPEKYRSQSTLSGLLVDIMLNGVDLLWQIATTPETEMSVWESSNAATIDEFLRSVGILQKIHAGNTSASSPQLEAETAGESESPSEKSTSAPVDREPAAQPPVDSHAADRPDSFLRVTTSNLNRILAIAGEFQIENQRLRPFSENLIGVKRQLGELNQTFDDLRDALASLHLNDEARSRLSLIQENVSNCRRTLTNQLADLEHIGRRHGNVSQRLYDAAIACRMRPFADGIQGFPRMVRDISKQLGKNVRLEVVGEDTQVDRDILEKLEAQITQLLRNAMDHGMETPADREAAGKPATGTITLEARHSSGKLMVSVADDGRGIDYNSLRAAIIQKGLTNEDTASRLSDAELLEFLFLPGFSQRDEVTEISGRGVGLDIVYNMVKAVRGAVRVYTSLGQGTRFELQLPLTLSVLRAMLADVNGEPYAFPLAQIESTARLTPEDISHESGLPRAEIKGQQVDLVYMSRVFDLPTIERSDDWHVIVAGDREHSYGLIVDRFLGERELVVQPLDPRLGKIPDISAGALMDDGDPVLIVDIQDVVRGAERVQRGETVFIKKEFFEETQNEQRILVADDSLTVREMERQVLEKAGYDVTVAVDGMDAWNSLRSTAQPFDLLITDMDMPRMSGTELTELVRANLGDLPIMMITYKDRPEDRQKAIAVGVTTFHTKGTFQDNTFLQEVRQLLQLGSNQNSSY
jgi:two-component system, chemotaxis family, sensor histidine kinase and response regulator WspE